MQLETALLIAIAVLLVEFHRRLRVVERGVRKLLELQGVGAGSKQPTPEVRQLALAGREIEAMRLYRQQSGAGLREAKQVVSELHNASAHRSGA